MTFGEIFVICALKGATVVILKKLGLWPAHAEDLAHRQPGPHAAAYAGVTLETFTDADGKVWAVRKDPSGEGLTTLRPAQRQR